MDRLLKAPLLERSAAVLMKAGLERWACSFFAAGHMVSPHAVVVVRAVTLLHSTHNPLKDGGRCNVHHLFLGRECWAR